MRWLNGYRIRSVLVGVVATIVVGGGSAKADFTFGEPINLGPPVNSGYSEWCPSVSPDGLELYFSTKRPVSGSHSNLWVAKRSTPEDPWAEPSPLGPEINSEEENHPHISPDGLELYFTSVRRRGGYGESDIWVSRRSALSAPWESAINLGPPINTSNHDYGPSITADGLELFFTRRQGPSVSSSTRSIWSAKRATREGPWGEPERLGELVNSSGNDCVSSISADGLFLCFSSHPNWAVRPGGQGGPDIWVTTRPTRDAPWGPPWNPGPPLSTAYFENNPSISADGRWLYFSDFWWGSPQNVRPGGRGSDDLWKAPILPVVDFNADGKVDGFDVRRMVESWHTDDSVCDVGPMPWGDGVVDVEDLKVLAEYIGVEVDDPTLIAHWALDEAEGDIAYDSAGDNDGVVMGTCAWQPTSGQVNGALESNGTNFVVADFVLNPGDGPFSVLAWVKGGAPGQVILAQQASTNWLTADPATGALMSELKSGGRLGTTLCSDAVITDGSWHHVSFVWDGSTRRLYVDDMLVAEGAQDGWASSSGGMSIGCGKDMAAGTFWQGLIDDVRIYNRAVTP